MRSALILAIVCIVCGVSFAQNSLRAVVKDADTSEPLLGATGAIRQLSAGASANDEGFLEIQNIPDGQFRVEFSFLGYKSKVIAISFPSAADTMEVRLEQEHEELEEIVITSTRSSRSIADIPTRVEFIAGEEIDEKANMKPGDIRMLLSESTGIQIQQTSATSANASIRIQGLDGRYTQILKDGFPLYAGFSGGLGLLQTPPLDLRQVEVIKGSSSTLYGGGAIAGLVNLISKTPSEEKELKFLINGTSAKGLDLSGFYGKKFGKAGLTVFAARNSGEPYDPADIDLTAIPDFERYTINPRLFLDFTERTSLNVGINFTNEDRIGGDLHYIEGRGDNVHRYFEENNTERYSTQLSFIHRIDSATSLHFKNSVNHFERLVRIPDYTFDGIQNSTFTELNLSSVKNNAEWTAGLNLWTDEFSERRLTATPLRDYDQTIIGAFIQNNAMLTDRFHLETGLRGDYVVSYGFALLPRISLLFKVNDSFTSRIGGGFGYKAPTFFTEETERIQYRNVLPVSADQTGLEKSYGANWDVNYHIEIGEVEVSINHLFFYTYLKRPLTLRQLPGGDFEFFGLDGFTSSKGTETNIKAEFGDFKLFFGYTLTDTRIHSDGSSIQNPLTARHRLNNVLMYEADEKWKMGLEAYYFSKQRLTDNSYGKEYWICGFMIERLWEKFSLFINFENFLDARQTRFDTIYTGSVSNPVFRDIYAPMDGFVTNGGLKLNL